MVLFLIPFCHLFPYKFGHILIQIFLQFIAGLEKGIIFVFGSRFDFRILVSVGGMVKSPKLISSPPDAGVFWVGHEFGVGLGKSTKFVLQFCLFLTHILIADVMGR